MTKRLGKNTILLSSKPSLLGWAAVASSMEGDGPLGSYFDKIDGDGYFGEKTWELAESKMQQLASRKVIEKVSLTPEDIQAVFAGDLLNQCIGSSYGLKDLSIPFVGLYGACSTMAESLMLAALFVDGGFASPTLAVTSSHFCTAERQFRFPLEYGNQRAPSSQWTATASGAVVVGDHESGTPLVKAVTIGTIQDLGITDANNMGAAMAPAAADTLTKFLEDSGKAPDFFDGIFTGDLGQVGSDLLLQLLLADNIDIKDYHQDCGILLYDRETQDVASGGSGCGCSASVLTTYILPRLKSGMFHNVLFIATGALMSTVAIQQGGSIPGIAHLVWLTSERSDDNE